MSPMEGTYLAWLDCREAGITGSPAEFFLESARVGLNDGAWFGEEGKGFVRLNFGVRRDAGGGAGADGGGAGSSGNLPRIYADSHGYSCV